MTPRHLPCIHTGAYIRQHWNRCDHPDTPRGGAVCPGIHCEPTCPGHYTGVRPVDPENVTWEYGVMTVPSRKGTYLPRTLRSLLEGGFDRPRLFVDGCGDTASWSREFSLEVTCRADRIGTVAAWYMALVELYARSPFADRYAVFQDDFVTYRRLRDYLDRRPMPEDGYLNLYTFASNMGGCPTGHIGWYPSNQLGRGAVGLVFSQASARAMLAAPHMVRKMGSADLVKGRPIRLMSVDGGIIESMKQAGFREYVHNPSLVQHIGEVTSMEGNPKHRQAEWWRGEEFDATELL